MTVAEAPAVNSGTSEADVRLRKTSYITKLLRRPELGAIAGAILIAILFMIYADDSMFRLSGIMTFMKPAAQLGILAIAAALLMIGGEFDLSVGSMWGFAGCVFGVAVVTWGMPLYMAIILTFAVACAVGAFNGQLVIRTGLPSFIVTLAFLFILRGLTLVFLKLATKPAAAGTEDVGVLQQFLGLFTGGNGGSTQLRGVNNAVGDQFGDGLLIEMFSGEAFGWFFRLLAKYDLVDVYTRGTKVGLPKVTGVPVEIVWFVGLALFATWLLLRTPYGNWIFASGGDANAARNQGVPVGMVKTSLFMGTAAAATLVAIITTLSLGSADAVRGNLKEFEAIIAAVIGGCLLTGGYGSAIGAFFGAIIFGMVSIGLAYTAIDLDWFKVALGAMLLFAVIFNNIIRKRATGGR